MTCLVQVCALQRIFLLVSLFNKKGVTFATEQKGVYIQGGTKT